MKTELRSTTLPLHLQQKLRIPYSQLDGNQIALDTDYGTEPQQDNRQDMHPTVSGPMPRPRPQSKGQETTAGCDVGPVHRSAHGHEQAKADYISWIAKLEAKNEKLEAKNEELRTEIKALKSDIHARTQWPDDYEQQTAESQQATIEWLRNKVAEQAAAAYEARAKVVGPLPDSVIGVRWRGLAWQLRQTLHVCVAPQSRYQQAQAEGWRYKTLARFTPGYATFLRSKAGCLDLAEAVAWDVLVNEVFASRSCSGRMFWAGRLNDQWKPLCKSTATPLTQGIARMLASTSGEAKPRPFSRATRTPQT
ncbi:hypothetical protein F4780DRAFT_513135 [Xylariomycetidae sp. FL0641]|nr:hypothetical protein F4780DRAFT_513135 [Xylariomycetidae sp. FL0641]